VTTRRRRPRRFAAPVLAAVTAVAAAVAVAVGMVTTRTEPQLEGKVKPGVVGLVDRDGPDVAASYASVVGNVVLDVAWSDVEPVEGSLDTSFIDRGLASARVAGRTVSLRLHAGRQSPPWVLDRVGSVVLYNAHGPDRGALSVPRWWFQPFASAFSSLHQRLARRYDAEPVLGQVVLCLPEIFYCEPFLRQLQDSRNVDALRSAGFTAEADQAAQRANYQLSRYWPRTPVQVSFNPYQRLNADGTKTVDVAYTISEMRAFRASAGRRAVLGNNSVRSADLGPAYRAMYAEQKALGGPLSYQTATAGRIGDWRRALDWAVDQGAQSVELPSGYGNWPPGELDDYARRLAANAP
jgi:hypothetical protein